MAAQSVCVCVCVKVKVKVNPISNGGWITFSTNVVVGDGLTDRFLIQLLLIAVDRLTIKLN